MLAVLAVFGVLFIIIGVAMLIVRPMINDKDVYEDRPARFGSGTEKVHVKHKGPSIALWFNKKRSIMVLLLGVVFLLVKGMFFYAQAGHNYFVQYINGVQTGVTTAGYHPKWFGEVTDWKKYITVKTVTIDDDIKFSGAIKSIPIRFVDQVTGQAEVSCRFMLPEDPEQFKKLALEFRTVENLLQSAIIPSIKEIVKVTAYQFAAQDYISGNASEFNFRFLDQCENGLYSTERIDGTDSTSQDIQADSSRQLEASTLQQYRVELLYDNGGNVLRKDHVINKIGLVTSQAIVENIELEDAFKERLKAQRDEAAKRQLEQQKTKTAIDTRERILTEGETSKAQKKVEEEMAQVTKLIAIETKLKEEATNLELANIQFKTQTIAAKTVKVNADAAAYEIRAKVNAGITPERELEMHLDAQVKIAAELAKTQWPDVLITGGEDGAGGSGGSLLYDMLGADYAKKMAGTTVPKK